MNNLETLRKHIDTVDDQLLSLIKERIGTMKQVGEAKKELQKPIRDPERESQKLAEIQQKAANMQIPASLATYIWKLFFEASEEIENKYITPSSC